MLVHQSFERSRRKFPQKTAITYLEETLSYEEVGKFSDTVASLIHKEGLSKGRIAFWMRRKPAAVATILGILKSGSAYVPLDPDSPETRVATILEDCNIEVLVIDNELLPKLPTVHEKYPRLKLILTTACQSTLGEVPTFRIEDHLGDPPHLPETGTSLEPAYIFYTSGSTGKPKGVIISHLNVSEFVEWAIDCFSISEVDNLANPTPLFFDLSTFDIHVTFCAGGTLHMISEKELISPKAILEWLVKHEISVWFSVPSILSFLNRMGVVKPNLFPHLRAILWCGEPFAGRDLHDWMQALPDKTYANLYGPTEATVASTYHIFKAPPEDPTQALTIGRPRSNTKAIVVDESGKLLGAGEVGELCLGGNCVMHGYWRNPEKNRNALFQNPMHDDYRDTFYRTGDLALWERDGTLTLKGRKDNQIKSRGYRIELGDIETAFTSHPAVDAACAVPYDAPEFGGTKIKVFFSSAQGGVELKALSEYVGKILPKYMMPQKMEYIEVMPRLPNGKVDRQACKSFPF